MKHLFEGFEVLEHERQLHIGGVRARVGARAFDVLLLLVKHHHRVVTKAELLDSVWPDKAVEDGNIQVQVSTLRKILGQQAIATIPGRGYRLTQRPVGAAGAFADEAAAALPGVPPSPSPGPRLTNLPSQLPPLYGRENDLARLHALLERHAIVSLVATGGVGKTRLARALAGAARDAFPDGVWCVELAELSHGDFVAPELARVLGYQVPGGRSAADFAVDVLRRQRTLILLDNCEHLLPAVAALVSAIHDAAPHVRLLITSQHPLKVPGERVYRLGTLALPEAPDLEATRNSGAVQMLVDRIQGVLPHFSLDQGNAARVAAVCRRLDGIPLALEFAAARVPVLGLEGLLARLDERFRVLSTGLAGGLQRHQTLRAALEFSHGLLDEGEQAVFRRISVFAGSFSADAAQDLAADLRLDRWTVLDHLGALVDKSLVLADAGDPPRLRMLETTRAFALEQLAAAQEHAAWRERHARVIAAAIARAAEDYWVLSDAALRDRYGAEQANLRDALAWALAHDAELAIEMSGNACALWREIWSQQPEGARYCEAALALVSASTPPRAAGRLHFALAWMLIWSQQQRARSAALRAAHLLRSADDRRTLSMALLLLIPGTTQPDAQQQQVLEELQQLHDTSAPLRAQAACVSAFARYAMGARHWDEASHLYARTRGLLAGCGSVQWEGVVAWTQAGIALTRGELHFAAETLGDTAARLLAEPTHGIFVAFCLGSLATAELLRGDVPAARAALTRAAPLIVRFDIGFRYAGTAAGLAAAEGRWEVAALLLSYGRQVAAASGVDAEEPAEIEVSRRAEEALAALVDDTVRAAWARAGTLLSTEAAYDLAIGGAAPG